MAYMQWKRHIPLCYDFFSHHELTVPSTCVRWGHVLSTDKDAVKQRLYYSERGAVVNNIVIAEASVAVEFSSDPDKMAEFDENLPSKIVQIKAQVPTPSGTEVNRLQALKEGEKALLLAKSDLSVLHVWDVSHPRDDLTPVVELAGHGAGACESSFAVAASASSRSVASGDKHGTVLLWDLAASPPAPGPAPHQLQPLTRLTGHEDTVEGVAFCPSAEHSLCSVGDDKSILFWDGRAGGSAVAALRQAAGVDLHCVGWNGVDENLVGTGAADGAVCVFDRRNAGGGGAGAVVWAGWHGAAVQSVEWRPGSARHLASGADDAALMVWDIARAGGGLEAAAEGGAPAQLIFKHAGHRGSIQDLQWSPGSAWCVASVAEDTREDLGGGSLHLWRPSDLAHRSAEEGVEELAQLQKKLRTK